jgi:hypothetical protein
MALEYILALPTTCLGFSSPNNYNKVVVWRGIYLWQVLAQ